MVPSGIADSGRQFPTERVAGEGERPAVHHTVSVAHLVFINFSVQFGGELCTLERETREGGGKKGRKGERKGGRGGREGEREGREGGVEEDYNKCGQTHKLTSVD